MIASALVHLKSMFILADVQGLAFALFMGDGWMDNDERSPLLVSDHTLSFLSENLARFSLGYLRLD